jgi:hypothetical protein
MPNFKIFLFSTFFSLDFVAGVAFDFASFIRIVLTVDLFFYKFQDIVYFYGHGRLGKLFYCAHV